MADEEVGRRFQFAPRCVFAAIAHASGDVQQRYGIQVEDRLGLGMVALAYVVAREAENVLHAQRSGAEYVALNSDAVAVAAGDLVHGRIAVGSEYGRGSDAGHVAVAARAIGHVDRIDEAAEERGALQQGLRVGGIRRPDFDRHDEVARAASLLECTELRRGRAALAHRRLEHRLGLALDDADPGGAAGIARVDRRQ